MTRLPLSSIGITLSTIPARSRKSCHGTMLEWCSMWEMITSSPGSRKARPKLSATRLIASVVPRAKTISSADAALMKRATFSRAPSKASVLRWLK
jgi:hypothetical protein